MSRRRISPTAWLDEGPAAPYTVTGRFDARPAATIAGMQPLIKGSVMSQTHDVAIDDAHAKADARLRQRYSIRPENRYEEPRREDATRRRWDDAPRCGALMAITGSPCARTAGHLDVHRSEWDLADNARRRRAG